jgi:large subunit ribosomal protein L37Ae
MATKKVGAAGRFGPRYGKTIRERITKIEAKQRKKQICPYCKKAGVKRYSKAIWTCRKCGKKFASSTYYLK